MHVYRVEREDLGGAQAREPAHVLEHHQAVLAVHDMLGVGRVEQGAAGGDAHGVEVHEQVGGRGRVDDLAGLGKLDDLLERAGELIGADLVGARDRDGGGGVNGKGALETVEVIALEGLAHGVLALVGEELGRQVLVEGEQHVVLGGEPGPGVVDDEEVVLLGKLLDGLALELGQRALLPDDVRAGVKLRVALGHPND